MQRGPGLLPPTPSTAATLDFEILAGGLSSSESEDPDSSSLLLSSSSLEPFLPLRLEDLLLFLPVGQWQRSNRKADRFAPEWRHRSDMQPPSR